MNKVVTSISEMYVDEDGILHVKILKDAVITLENIKKNFAVYKELYGDKKVLILIDSRVKFKFTKEARAYTAGNQMDLNRVAVAYIMGSFANRWIISLYIRFNKPVVPTRMFGSEARAIKWLKSFYVMPGEKYLKQKNKKK